MSDPTNTPADMARVRALAALVARLGYLIRGARELHLEHGRFEDFVVIAGTLAPFERFLGEALPPGMRRDITASTAQRVDVIVWAVEDAIRLRTPDAATDALRVAQRFDRPAGPGELLLLVLSDDGTTAMRMPLTVLATLPGAPAGARIAVGEGVDPGRGTKGGDA